MPGITPFLWFDNQAEEAANFYVALFPNSRIRSAMRAGESGPNANAPVVTVAFELDGREFVALNGGPRFPFTEAVSFVVSCETQEEVDRYWNHLIADGGSPSMCGWLKDKYGLSWQIVPSILGKLLGDPEPERARRAMNAMLQMRKLDIAALKAAAAG